MVPHLPEQELEFEVVVEVQLLPIDFENFLYDLRADRMFLERYLDRCGVGTPLRCILVTCEQSEAAVAAVPAPGGYVAMAALIDCRG